MRKFLKPAVFVAATFVAAGAISETAGAIAYSDPSAVAEAPGGVVGIHNSAIMRLEPWNRFCTGVVIGRRWVLTAAHCVDQAGGTRGLSIGVPRGEVIDPYAISTIFIHPKFPRGENLTMKEIGMGYDIALVRTKVAMRHVQPLAPSKTWVGSSGRYVVYGYGLDENWVDNFALGGREVFLADHLAGELTVNPGRQFAAIGTYEHTETGPDGEAISKTVYDGIARQGDSGGPVILYTDEGAIEIAGIVSYGYVSGGSYPVVYTKVSRFAEWIANTMRTASSKMSETRGY